MGKLWPKAKEALEKCGRVVIIGLSLREADYQTRWLLRTALAAARPRDIEIDVGGGGPASATRRPRVDSAPVGQSGLAVSITWLAYRRVVEVPVTGSWPLITCGWSCSVERREANCRATLKGTPRDRASSSVKLGSPVTR